MKQGSNNPQGLFSDLEDIELSLDEESVSQSGKGSESESLNGYRDISPLSVYLHEIKGYPLIDHELEFWYGVSIQTGKLLEECLEEFYGRHDRKANQSHFLFERIFENIREIQEIEPCLDVLKLDIGELLSEALILRTEDFSENSSYLLNLINENKIYEDENLEEVARRAVQILACFNALPLELFAALSVFIYENRYMKGIPAAWCLLRKYNHGSWRIEDVNERAARAREKLCLANLRLVVKFAKKNQGRGIPFHDLIQAGNEGLLEAVKKYDPSLGTKFSTYAHSWIRQRILRSIRNESRLVRIPSYIYDRYSKVWKVERELVQKLDHFPDDSEIAEQIEDISENDVREIKYLFSHDTISLDMPASKDSDTLLADFLPDRKAENPFDVILWQDFRESVLQKVDEITDERGKYIFCARYGFLDGEIHTLKELGEELGVTRERVRQIQDKIIRKLRHPVNRHLFAIS